MILKFKIRTPKTVILKIKDQITLQFDLEDHSAFGTKKRGVAYKCICTLKVYKQSNAFCTQTFWPWFDTSLLMQCSHHWINFDSWRFVSANCWTIPSTFYCNNNKLRSVWLHLLQSFQQSNRLHWIFVWWIFSLFGSVKQDRSDLQSVLFKDTTTYVKWKRVKPKMFRWLQVQKRMLLTRPCWFGFIPKKVTLKMKTMPISINGLC